MKSRYMLLATLLAAGGSHGVPHYGPAIGVGPGPGAGPESYRYGSAVGPQVADPAFALRAGVDKLLAFLGVEQRPSEQALAEFLEREIVPYFDFEYMAESAGGRLYEQQGDQERQAMVEGIKTSFLSKMAEKLGGYQNQQLRYLPPRLGMTAAPRRLVSQSSTRAVTRRDWIFACIAKATRGRYTTLPPTGRARSCITETS